METVANVWTETVVTASGDRRFAAVADKDSLAGFRLYDFQRRKRPAVARFDRPRTNWLAPAGPAISPSRIPRDATCMTPMASSSAFSKGRRQSPPRFIPKTPSGSSSCTRAKPASTSTPSRAGSCRFGILSIPAPGPGQGHEPTCSGKATGTRKSRRRRCPPQIGRLFPELQILHLRMGTIESLGQRRNTVCRCSQRGLHVRSQGARAGSATGRRPNDAREEPKPSPPPAAKKRPPRKPGGIRIAKEDKRPAPAKAVGASGPAPAKAVEASPPPR